MIIIIALLKKNVNSRILNFVKSHKIRNSRKFEHAKITRSTVYPSLKPCISFYSIYWTGIYPIEFLFQGLML